MSSLGPAFISTASIIAGLLFAHVAYHVATRRYPGEVRSVAVAFSVAWAGLASIAIIDGLRVLSGSYAPDALAWYAALTMLKFLANGAVIWGLGVFVIYLWSGRTRAIRWSLAAFAAAHALFFIVYAFPAVGAVAVTSGRWVPRLVLEGPLGTSPPMLTVILTLFFLPPVLLVLAYGTLAWRIGERTLRYRIAATGLAIGTFQMAGLLYSLPTISGDSAVFPVLAVVTLLSGLAAYITYHPPAWLAQRTSLEADQSSTGRPASWIRSARAHETRR